ncbi:hypothetical protein [Catellatospora vulcania]|uniref:hypothetical protein n=1 Tax=Catellatospora vulcania TaxID=1460450 RepID=UPI0012D3E63D|nr:hypothetical protein [Catellatospora vulcania]
MEDGLRETNMDVVSKTTAQAEESAMFGSPELYFDLAKLHHKELIDEAARERIAARVLRHRRLGGKARDRVHR